jgi:tRNA (cytosine34-C5)-methyltransferase
MGRQGRAAKTKRNQKMRESDKDANGWTKENAPYDIIVKENANFEKYYRQLNICQTNEEFNEMLATLQKPLPITFRITKYKSFSREVMSLLKNKHFAYLDAICNEDDGELVAASGCISNSLLREADKQSNEQSTGKIYECLSWYPNELAWKVLLSRNDVRKNVHFENFKLFLMHQTENGNLNRQEAVSMIPPLLLDVQSHHKILDMCASPGSKTAQLIEMLHADPSNPTPEGFVIANDLDNKRCYMLMHQLKRLESPNFMIVNHDASTMPNMRGEDGANIMYDRILADVPCSGDGTFRKNIGKRKGKYFISLCYIKSIL